MGEPTFVFLKIAMRLLFPVAMVLGLGLLGLALWRRRVAHGEERHNER
jgi:hypothetical protein